MDYTANNRDGQMHRVQVTTRQDCDLVDSFYDLSRHIPEFGTLGLTVLRSNKSLRQCQANPVTEAPHPSDVKRSWSFLSSSEWVPQVLQRPSAHEMRHHRLRTAQ